MRILHPLYLRLEHLRRDHKALGYTLSELNAESLYHTVKEVMAKPAKKYA